MTGISTSLTLKDRFTNTLNKGAASVDRMLKGMRAVDTTTKRLNPSKPFSPLPGILRRNTSAMQDFNREQAEAAKGAEKVKSAWSGVGGLIRTALAAVGVGKIIGLSDSLTSTTARLNLMNDGSQSTDELSSKIMASAQRSRADYLSTANAIASMGTNAGAAFKSNDELIAFMEQVNKQFVIGGATAEGQAAAMTQLTQAMAAGALRGEELNSILENAPGIARAIESYMGVAEGSIKKYAEEGLISAKVVKNALFKAAEETNGKFESMPKTYAQVWTQIKNSGLSAFNAVLARVNQFLNSDVGTAMVNGIIQGFNMLAAGANWLMDAVTNVYNAISSGWKDIQPILEFAAPIALGVIIGAMVAWAISATQAAIATITAMSPIILIALAIGAAIGLVIALAMDMGATFGDVCGFIGGVLGGLYALGYNLVADAWNLIATFAEFFGNVFNNPVAAIGRLFYGLLDVILGVVETAANAIDALLGTDMSGAINGFRDSMNEWVDGIYGEQKVKIDRMDKLDYGQTIADWEKGGKAFGDGVSTSLDSLAGAFSSDSLLDGFGTDDLATTLDGANLGSVGEVGKIKNDVNIADEDIKLMKDVAEMRYVQNFVTLEPSISMAATVNKDADFDAFYNEFDRRVASELEAAAEDVYF